MQDIPTRILVVDDEMSARLPLAEILQLDGYEVTTADGGKDALTLLPHKPFDIVLTDIKMPQVDGLAVLRSVKEIQPDCVVILLTAYGALDTAVAALREGGFDYLLKPVNAKEVLETVRRAEETIEENNRRMRLIDQMELTLQALKGDHKLFAEGARGEVLAYAGIVIDLEKHVVTAFGDPLDLTPTEFSILTLLMRQPGRIFTSAEILKSIKGFISEDSGAQAAVRVYISRLRQKIETDPKRPRYLQTVRGVGYRFTP